MKEEMGEPMQEAFDPMGTREFVMPPGMGVWKTVPPEELPQFHRERACSQQPPD